MRALASLLLLLASAPASASLPTGGEAKSVVRTAAPGPATAAGSAYSQETLREEIRALARRGLFDSALALSRRALEFDSGDTYARFMAGKLTPEGKASAEHFQRVLQGGKPGPELEESRFRLGQYYYAAGRYHQAIPSFREYLRLHPRGDWREPAQYWMGSACLAFAQSRPERATYLDSGAVYFQRLLESTRGDHYYHALALEGLAKARMAQGDWDGAWQAAKSALEKAPEDERASILLLSAQLRRNVDREEERRLLQRLATEHPQSPEVRHLRRLNGHADPARWRAPVPPGPARPAPKADIASPAAPAGNPAVTPPAAAASGGRPPAPPAEGSFTLQLGAFAQAANAQALLADLAKQGIAAERVESRRSGKTIHQVRLGRFKTSEDAVAYAQAHLKPRKILSQAVAL